MSRKYNTPQRALGPAPASRYHGEDNKWLFSSDIKAWCPGAKINVTHYKEKGLRGVKTGRKRFGGDIQLEGRD